jgi:hypothetical protein
MEFKTGRMQNGAEPERGYSERKTDQDHDSYQVFYCVHTFGGMCPIGLWTVNSTGRFERRLEPTFSDLARMMTRPFRLLAKWFCSRPLVQRFNWRRMHLP